MDTRTKVTLRRGRKLSDVTWREERRTAFKRAELLARTHKTELICDGDELIVDATEFYDGKRVTPDHRPALRIIHGGGV